MSDIPKLQSIREAADAVGFSYDTLKAYISRGILPADAQGQRVGDTRVFTESEIEKLRLWKAARPPRGRVPDPDAPYHNKRKHSARNPKTTA